MGKYNTGYLYNYSAASRGINYNSARYVKIINIADTTSSVEELISIWNNTLVSDNSKVTDTSFLSTFQEIFDSAQTSDAMKAIVKVFIQEYGKLQDDFKQLATIIVPDSAKAKETSSLKSLILSKENVIVVEKEQIKAKLRYDEKSKAIEKITPYALIFGYDSAQGIDSEPKVAISDFYINRDGLFIPLRFRVDYDKTVFSDMPEAIETTKTIAGMDGDVVLDTVYGTRRFEIVGFSDDGLDRYEKEDLRELVRNTLHSVKNETKILSVAEWGRTYNVKYSGAASFKNYPGWIEITMPLTSHESYGRDMFKKEADATDVLVNEGVEPSGYVLTISGNSVNPYVILNDVRMSYNGTIPTGYKLIINSNNKTAKMQDTSGKFSNAMLNYNKAFPLIPIGNSGFTVPSNLKGKVLLEWYDKYL